ncbi:MAG: hypothetical protein EBY80_06685, partial [Actinobacteria bacterium]|nr:hypothetical protein [Actinomycetota bacterium]
MLTPQSTSASRRERSLCHTSEAFQDHERTRQPRGDHEFDDLAQGILALERHHELVLDESPRTIEVIPTTDGIEW